MELLAGLNLEPIFQLTFLALIVLAGPAVIFVLAFRSATFKAYPVRLSTIINIISSRWINGKKFLEGYVRSTTEVLPQIGQKKSTQLVELSLLEWVRLVAAF